MLGTVGLAVALSRTASPIGLGEYQPAVFSVHFAGHRPAVPALLVRGKPLARRDGADARD
ncbi:hypothetical protein [Actinokineospora sp.]|uniref:hypothetical protein n=1 Tax=Actinokineospora sp. TaxID=1872133 RepID=UPI00403830AF